MRLTLRAVSVVALLCACGIEASAPPFDAQGSGVGGGASSVTRAAGPSGGRFFCRTDAGFERALVLRRFSVQATIRPGTVRSHLTIELAGPANERVEAVMRLAVPRGAAVTSAVLWVAGRAMSGAFVERDRAREIYRSIVERRRDPALVTWDGPGWVSVSIFPLERGEARRFEIEWVEPAATAGGSLQYRVPAIADGGHIVGWPSLEVDGRAVPTAGRQLVPIAPAPAAAAAIFVGRTPGEPFHQLLVRSSVARGAPRFVLVAETSRAMTPGDRTRQHAAIDTVLGALGADARVTIVAADWSPSAIVEDVAPVEARRALAALDAIVSAGALHLERALADAVTRARKSSASAVVFVGRGEDGFGGDAVDGPLRELRDAGVRLSIIATNEVRPSLGDAAALTGGEALSARELDDGLGALVDALRLQPDRPVLSARGAGDWRALETITGQTVWLGRALEAPLPPGGAAVASGAAADLLALWDRARLAWFDRDARPSADLTMPSVLTPLRSLLVLETEQDYARFGLAAEEGGRGRSHRGEEGKMGKRSSRQGLYGLKDRHDAGDLPAERRAVEGANLGSLFGRDSARGNDAQDVLGSLMGRGAGVSGAGVGSAGSGASGTAEGTMGLGNLGTIGQISAEDGSHANGSGYGRGAGGVGPRIPQAPDVVPGQAVVRGSLDREIIRRVVRRHINELRFCYEQGLFRSADLGGRVWVQFAIAPLGQVTSSVLQSSTLRNGSVESCVVQAVRRWEFPHPLGGGSVIVSYPFLLTPGIGVQRVSRRSDSPSDPAGSPRDLDRSLFDSLAILARPGTLADRVARIASLLGFDRTSDPETVAWTIDRSGASLDQMVLVARLLDAAGRRHDAVRVLSERARFEPGLVAAELRRMKEEGEAVEVLALSKRGP
jgi:hypothetical protein